jgi:hypothetical protein
MSILFTVNRGTATCIALSFPDRFSKNWIQGKGRRETTKGGTRRLEKE